MEFVFAVIGFIVGVSLCMVLVFGFHPLEKANYELREELVNLNKKIEKLQTENQNLNTIISIRNKYSDRCNPETLHWFELNRTVDELSRQKIILSKDKMMLESDIAALEKLLQERKEEYFNDNSKN
jgi:hypothetical protein